MTETEWFHRRDWRPHLAFLGERVGPRKARLLAAGFCRQAWGLFEDAECRAAVETAERYANGFATVADLEECRKRCRVLAVQAAEAHQAGPEHLFANLPRCEVAWAAANVAAGQLDPNNIGSRLEFAATQAPLKSGWTLSPGETVALVRSRGEHLRQQRAVLLDLFGNPFQPVTFNPAWRSAAVTALARAVLERGDFSTMPVLADALHDAGCESPAVLDHCRDGGPHFLGCWVIDGLLGLA